MEFSAKQIAGFVNGEIVGDPEKKVNNLARIEEGKAGDISFLANPKYTPYIYKTKSSVVIVNQDFIPEKDLQPTLIKVEDAYTAFATILQAYQEAQISKRKGISPLAFVHPSASIGKDCYIGEFVYVGENAVIGDNSSIFPLCYIGEGVKIGSECLFHPSVKILDHCIVGNQCVFHSGVVVGSDGFGFAPRQDADFKKVAQIGNVIIHDLVELGANTTIDRATMGSTVLHRGVKLDNLCQIAHNVEVGENTVMAAQSGVAGSTKIGKNCMFGGQVAINGHITIADGVKLAAKTGVANSIKKEGAVHMHVPSFEHRQAVQSFIYYKKLPDLARKIDALEKELQELKKQL